MNKLLQTKSYFLNWLLLFVLLFATTNSFARIYDGNETIYLRPSAVNWWLNDNAKVGMYFNDGSTGVFVELYWLVDNDGGNIWSAKVPAGTWNKVIVTRHSSSPISWGNRLNQSWDIEIHATANYIQSFSENSTTVNWQTLNANYRSKATGNWSELNTWISSFDNNWTNSWNYFDSHYVPNNNDLSVAIMNDHTVTLNQDAIVTSLTINTGGTFTASDASPRTLTIAKSASGSSTTLANNGTWANGTGGSTVVFSGAPSSGDAIHAITGTIAFQNVIINKTGGSNNVGASFGNGSSVTGTLEIGVGGYVASDPPEDFYGSEAILKFNQGVAATYEVNEGDKTWSTTEVPNNITINTGTVNINEDRTATGDIIINGKLSISAGISLTIDGDLTNSAGVTGLVIKSDATGTGSLINSSTGVAATVERYISGAAEAWHLISSPVSGQEISGVWTPSGSYAGGWGYDFYAWDEPSATWLNQKVGANNITSFVPGKGYLVAFQATNPTKTFTGTLNSGNITLPVTVSGSTTFGYANLAGNPYSSSIDWKNNSGFTRSMLKDDDIGVGVGYSLYTWNQSENNYGAYISNSTSDEGTLGVSRYVSPMQGFFVVAASAGDFVINNNARVHSAQAWLKSGNDNSFRLKATAPANYGSDELLLEFGHESSNGGAEKWSSFVAEAPGIYTPKNGKNYSISFLNSVSENPVIPVSFTAGVQGNYTISADFNSDVFSQVSLRDNKTGDMQDMRINPVYSFSATPGDDANRFSLHFSSVGIDETSDLKAMNAYFHDGLLYVSNTPSNAQITLSTLTGQVVMQRNAGGSGLVTLNAASLPKGVYIVTVQGEGARVSRKVVL